jgi:hypothetical protein
MKNLFVATVVLASLFGFSLAVSAAESGFTVLPDMQSKHGGLDTGTILHRQLYNVRIPTENGYFFYTKYQFTDDGAVFLQKVNCKDRTAKNVIGDILVDIGNGDDAFTSGEFPKYLPKICRSMATLGKPMQIKVPLVSDGNVGSLDTYDGLIHQKIGIKEGKNPFVRMNYTLVSRSRDTVVIYLAGDTKSDSVWFDKKSTIQSLIEYNCRSFEPRILFDVSVDQEGDASYFEIESHSFKKLEMKQKSLKLHKQMVQTYCAAK